jgi:hypothetical protein
LNLRAILLHRQSCSRTTGAGSYNDAYLAAAALLVVASALTFVTRMLEKKHKTQFGV